MANSFSGSVTAAQVGPYFVGQYYQVLQQQPDFVHQFYTDASSMIRIDGDLTETASATPQIHNLVKALNFSGIEIKTINSLDSWNGGVLVMVSGSVKLKDYGNRRLFMQSFFLAPQEKGYFVLNDIFQFIEEEAIQQIPSSTLSENILDSPLNASPPLPEPPVSNYDLEDEAMEYVNSHNVEEDDLVDKYSLPEQQHEEETVAETVVEETPAEEPSASLQTVVEVVEDSQPPPAEEPVAEPQKHTYASILRAAKANAMQPSFYKSTPPASEWHYNTPAPVPAPQTVTSSSSVFPASSVEATEDSLTQEEEGESRSVYVKNLSSTVVAADIEQEFKNFGRIKPDGVFIRSRKEIGVCYAFVEFEDALGVQNAIKASPIQIDGRQVYIEERRASNISSSSRGGRTGPAGGTGRGRARGSYQTDAPRGRGSGGRSFARGGQDGGDYNRSSRGNGYLRGSTGV